MRPLLMFRDEATKSLVLRGVFVGDDVECFEKAAELSLKVNFTLLEEPVNKVNRGRIFRGVRV